MLLERKDLPNSRVKLVMSANAHQFRHAMEHELEHVAADVTVPGFRPGKAPAAKVLERVGRQRVEAGAIDHAISDVYFETMQEQNLVPVETPKISVEEYNAPADADADDKEVMKFTIEVDVMPEVKVEGYQKIKIKKQDEPRVEEDEVEKVLDYLLKQRASLKEVAKDAKLVNGMWADLAYEGSVDGVKRDDMKNERHPLVIGEGSLIPGFEDAILGMQAGEERDIEVTFPKEYHAAELAGKKAKFHVTVNELKTVELPERNDEFGKHFGHDSYEALVKAIRENLQEEKQQESKQQLEEEILDELIKVAKFDLPQSLVTQEMERMYQESRERLDKMNFQWDTYLSQVGKTEKEVREEMRPQAEKNVKIGLALGMVMDLEGIKTKEGSGREAVDRLVEIATANAK